MKPVDYLNVLNESKWDNLCIIVRLTAACSLQQPPHNLQVADTLQAEGAHSAGWSWILEAASTSLSRVNLDVTLNHLRWPSDTDHCNVRGNLSATPFV